MVQKKTQIASADHRLIMAWVRGEREALPLAAPEVLERYTCRYTFRKGVAHCGQGGREVSFPSIQFNPPKGDLP